MNFLCKGHLCRANFDASNSGRCAFSKNFAGASCFDRYGSKNGFGIRDLNGHCKALWHLDIKYSTKKKVPKLPFD